MLIAHFNFARFFTEFILFFLFPSIFLFLFVIALFLFILDIINIDHIPNNKHDSETQCNSSVGPKPVPEIQCSNDFFVQAFGRIFVGKQKTDDPCNNEEKIDFPDVLSVDLFGFFNQIQRLYQIGLLALDSSVCLSQKFLKFMKFIISLWDIRRVG